MNHATAERHSSEGGNPILREDSEQLPVVCKEWVPASAGTTS
jgi:hypothetical protein